MLVARTPEEARLSLDLHPCTCGAGAGTAQSRVEERGEQRIAVYATVCLGCGTERRVEFAADGDGSATFPSFGGVAPSQIIDPGELHRVSDAAARRVPVNPDAVPRDRWRSYREGLAAFAD